MKVVLEAFGGKLRSEPMDWPEDVGPSIRLALDLDGSLFYDFNGRKVVDEPSRPVIGRFESTGQGVFLDGGGSASIYRLVGVDQ